MILYEGRTVSWKGHNVVIMHKVSSDRVKVCYESNPRVQRIVKVEDLKPKKTGWRGV